MIWKLFFILFEPDGSWSAHYHPDDKNPQIFASEAEAKVAGEAMIDGDGDNEHFVVVPFEKDGG
jgi:hypothetical protein